MRVSHIPRLRPGLSIHLGEYLGAGTTVQTEDDVLHVRHLPDFGGHLSAADSEVLIQARAEIHAERYTPRDTRRETHAGHVLPQVLLHPYLRVPLLLRFFSAPSRTPALASPELRRMLDAALFEPGPWEAPGSRVAPTHVGGHQMGREHMTTPAGLLFSELVHAPKVRPSDPLPRTRGLTLHF